MVSFTDQHVFGMCFCNTCPDGNRGQGNVVLCQGLFGSDATPEGGCSGRIAAGDASIEAQKSSGSLHAHSLLSVQCLHLTCNTQNMSADRQLILQMKP